MLYLDSLDLEDGNYFSKRKMRKSMAPDGVHVPNKNEATLLRKIMSKYGLTEKEVREIKKYRVMLSDTQKVKTAKLSDDEKEKKYLMKLITRKYKLAKEHPVVVECFNKNIKNLKTHGPYDI